MLALFHAVLGVGRWHRGPVAKLHWSCGAADEVHYVQMLLGLRCICGLCVCTTVFDDLSLHFGGCPSLMLFEPCSLALSSWAGVRVISASVCVPVSANTQM